MGFFDDLTDVIVDAGNNMSDKAKEIADIAKLKKEYKDTEKQVIARYEEIGRKFYLKYKNDPKKNLDDITEALDKMDNLKLQLESIRKTVECPTCGAKNDRDAVYCSKCGSQMEASSEDAEKMDAEIVEDESESKDSE